VSFEAGVARDGKRATEVRLVSRGLSSFGREMTVGIRTRP